MNKFIPIAASAHAAGIDGEMVAVHMLMGMLFVGWLMYFAWVLFRFNARRQPEPLPTAARGRVAMAVTAGVALVEVAMLLGVALPMWRRRVTAPPDVPGTIAVRVVAQQYVWTFHYPGADGQFGETRPGLMSGENPVGLDRTSPHGADDIVTPVFHVPVGRQVVAQLTSKDVIHSFGVPALRVKQDAIPGVVGTVWFTPTVEGQYDIACSQLCGPLHFRMRGTVVVDSLDGYAAFLANEAALLTPPAPAPGK